jgi:general secretion pathway protein G
MRKIWPSDGKGFTLVELMVSVAILAVLAGAVLPLAKVAVKREKEIELRRNLRIIRSALDEYKKLADEKKFEFDEDTYGYPPDLETLVEGVEIVEQDEEGKEKTRIVRFLRRLPRDPLTRDGEWGLRAYQDDLDSDFWGGENVFDVFTVHRGTALDGTRYRDW